MNRKERQDQEAQSHIESATYKYIPHHMHIIYFEHVTLFAQKSQISEIVFCISFVKA